MLYVQLYMHNCILFVTNMQIKTASQCASYVTWSSRISLNQTDVGNIKDYLKFLELTLSADNEANWQRMVLEGRTFFLQWIFMTWLAKWNRISTFRFMQIASLAAVSFFCPYRAQQSLMYYIIKHRGKREGLHSFVHEQYRSVKGLGILISRYSQL